MAHDLMTPSKITAWLECPHYLTLRSQVESGQLDDPKPVFGSFARLVADKGLAHEQECLEDYRRQGLSIFEVSERREHERFADWVARVGNPLEQDYDVVYQMPFVHDGIRGIADFVVRVRDPETGAISYEPVDAKLTRVEAKPGHVLQLCFYADAIEALTGAPANECTSGWDRANWSLCASTSSVRTGAGYVPSSPLPWTPVQMPRPSHDRARIARSASSTRVCEERWRSEDSLIYVAGIRQTRHRRPGRS